MSTQPKQRSSSCDGPSRNLQPLAPRVVRDVRIASAGMGSSAMSDKGLRAIDRLQALRRSQMAIVSVTEAAVVRDAISTLEVLAHWAPL